VQGRGLICSEGPVWAEQRQWLGVAMRGLLKGRSLERETAASLVEELGAGAGQWLDLGPVLSHHVGNFMNQLIFGIQYEKDSAMWKYLQVCLQYTFFWVGGGKLVEQEGKKLSYVFFFFL
jgi:hypothetical protein